MTGRELRTLRAGVINVDPFAWAAVLGVHVSTVYRWEATRGTVAMDRMQDELLFAIMGAVAAGHVARIRKAILDGAARGGPLFALHDVLEIVIPYRRLV